MAKLGNLKDAEYAKALARCKELEARLADAEEGLRIARSRPPQVVKGISEDDLRRMMRDILLSESVSVKALHNSVTDVLEKTDGLGMAIRTLSRNDEFMKLRDAVGSLDGTLVRSTHKMAQQCENLRQITDIRLSPEAENMIDEKMKSIADSFRRSMEEATQETFERMRDGSGCTILSVTSWWFVIVTLLLSVAYFVGTLIANAEIWHNEALSGFQWKMLAMWAVVTLPFVGYKIVRHIRG